MGLRRKTNFRRRDRLGWQIRRVRFEMALCMDFGGGPQ